MNGPDLRDPYAVPAPLRHPDDVDLGSLRVTTYFDDGISPPTADVAAVVEAAAVVRCGTSGEGLPIGVQIVARPWQDATALAVAGHLESVFGGWRPPPTP